MRSLRENWIGYLITFLLSIAGSFIILASTNAREDSKTIETKIENKADKTYVDKQDAMLQGNLIQHKLDDKEKIELILLNIQDIKETQKIILQKMVK